MLRPIIDHRSPEKPCMFFFQTVYTFFANRVRFWYDFLGVYSCLFQFIFTTGIPVFSVSYWNLSETEDNNLA